MEHGNPYFYYVPDAESSCGSNFEEEGNSSPTTNGAPSNSNNPVPHLAMPEEDLSLPIKNVARIMQKVLPPDVDVSSDALEIIRKCGSKFISYITREANKQRKSENGKGVDVNRLLLSMNKCGLTYYVDPLIVFHDRYLQHEADRLTGGGVQRAANDVMPPPPPQQSIVFNGYGLRSTSSTHPGMFNYTAGMGELYKDGAGASDSGTDNAMNNFDPLAYLNLDHFSDN